MWINGTDIRCLRTGISGQGGEERYREEALSVHRSGFSEIPVCGIPDAAVVDPNVVIDFFSLITKTGYLGSVISESYSDFFI